MIEAIVAGHICLDVIPTLEQRQGDTETLFVPGKLVVVGPMMTVTGGAVSNTGLALHRLGIPTRLMGKVGDDLFGRATLDVLRSYDPALADGMIVAKGEASSYTVVVDLFQSKFSTFFPFVHITDQVNRRCVGCPFTKKPFVVAEMQSEVFMSGRKFC